MEKHKIRIGLLLDSRSVPQWIASLIDFLQTDKRFEICFIAINDAAKSHSRSSFFYRLLRRIDRKLMRLPDDPLTRVPLPKLNAEVIEVIPEQKKYSDLFPVDAIEQIKNKNPDLLLRFGFRILRGNILKAARYGILSLHHGDTNEYRGGPPAFWEVVNKSPVTGVTLQLLTEQLDAGNIIDKCFLRTDLTSFYRNQQKLYWAGLKLFKDAFVAMAQQGIDEYFHHKRDISFGDNKGFLYRNPGNGRAIGIAASFIYRTFFRKIRSLFVMSQWQIIYSAGEQDVLKDDLSAYKKLIPPKDRIWADPFVVKHDDQFFLFFEEKYNNASNAHIVLVRFAANGELLDEKPVTVLKEDFHLSYPFVFNYRDKYYMIPESAAAEAVILYEAQEFPFSWKKKKVLLSGKKYYDATIHHHDDGKYYLFCTVKEDANLSSDAYLHIYYADDLLNDDFKPHPLNPVYKDVRLSRPAGNIFYHNKILLRPSQISAPAYGYATAFNKITHLSTTDFSEECFSVRLPGWQQHIIATHTINSVNSFHVADILVERWKW